MISISPYGTHRVIHPIGVLPQAAQKIDNSMVCQETEILFDVETLNIDSASFTQIRQSCKSDLEKMKKMILQIVEERGKMQNPVTGSGGMFLGRVKEIGRDANTQLQIGDRVASLVSLSLTPLKIHKIKSIDIHKDTVEVDAEAILFESGIYAKIPDDLPPSIVLSALDVCGAPAQVERLVKPGNTVLILGAAGKSGLLVSYQARKSAGKDGFVIGVINDERQKNDLEMLQVCDAILVADATNPVEIYEKTLQVTNGQLVDVSINVVNVPNTEMSAILPTKDEGIVYFFSMATSFSRAALGAEGVGKECKMMIGNGYTAGHADLTLQLLRESDVLMAIFKRRYGKEEKR
ncbi:MAG: L-erythro-3,5-diaminohexanoate dehydrogenase [Candidatus Izemoplasmatales bacterium]